MLHPIVGPAHGSVRHFGQAEHLFKQIGILQPMWPYHLVSKYFLLLVLQKLQWPIIFCAHLAIASPLSPYKYNEKIGGQRLVYGDILLSPRQIKLSRLIKTGQMTKHIALKAKQNNRWPNNEIPFIFSSKFNERQKRAIREALAVLEDSSCFRFIPRTNQRDFLFIDMQEGCFSFVGKVGGRQLLSLAAGCLHDYIIWHEVMHALGLEHEHQRPDRDKFIRIHWENVEPDKHLNFEKIPHADVDLYHTYDYHSLMHYDGTAFGKTDTDTGDPMTTMEPLRDGVELTDNFELTKFDVEKLQILSKCEKKRDGI
ncbi:hypothetical protein niasHT_035555 [Heterodera trifolii]|uniref:Metalloendopeptidase n=1 Tax=Heterodera trifolii TaxID=157864 RepID=A0ABD2HU92_9BILA